MKQSIGAKPIVYPAPVLIVGTYDGNGKPNVMAVAWGGICCSNPPCVTISLRRVSPGTVHLSGFMIHAGMKMIGGE